jgi:hypothetical protein
MQHARKGRVLTLFMAPEDVVATLPTLRRDWADHDVLVMKHPGNSVVATLLDPEEHPGMIAH